MPAEVDVDVVWRRSAMDSALHAEWLAHALDDRLPCAGHLLRLWRETYGDRVVFPNTLSSPSPPSISTPQPNPPTTQSEEKNKRIGGGEGGREGKRTAPVYHAEAIAAAVGSADRLAHAVETQRLPVGHALNHLLYAVCEHLEGCVDRSKVARRLLGPQAGRPLWFHTHTHVPPCPPSPIGGRGHASRPG